MRKKGAALLRHPPPFPEDLFVAQIVGWFVLSIASRPKLVVMWGGVVIRICQIPRVC